MCVCVGVGGGGVCNRQRQKNRALFQALTADRNKTGKKKKKREEKKREGIYRQVSTRERRG